MHHEFWNSFQRAFSFCIESAYNQAFVFMASATRFFLLVFKKKRFEPSLALGMALKPAEVTTSLEISEEQFQNYVSGATFATDKAVSKGWVQLTVGGNGLGFAKNVNGIIKNYFPKGLRFIS